MVIAPLVSHRIWKKQTSVTNSLRLPNICIFTFHNECLTKRSLVRWNTTTSGGSTLSEFLGILRTIQVLFNREGIGTLAVRLSPKKDKMLDGATGAEVQARLFAKALNFPEKVVAQVKF
jgi:hypothetical protein